MRWLLRWFRPVRDAVRLRKRIEAALAAIGRGGDFSNDMRLESASTRLKVVWRARRLHAWDADLPPERSTLRFARQTLADTEEALQRLFAICPEVDLIEMAVLEPKRESGGLLMSGSVSREEFESCHPPSTAMRLRLVGVNYLFVDGRIQALDPPVAALEKQGSIDGQDSRESRKEDRDKVNSRRADKLH